MSTGQESSCDHAKLDLENFRSSLQATVPWNHDINNGTGRVCLLEKSLYGLKQARHEWNILLNRIMVQLGYTHLCSDSCTYVKCCGKDFIVVTVWVDNLLLFATTPELMEKIKNDLHSHWEMTDLGEPSKIIGIEVNQSQYSITILQKLYIELILKHKGMEHANPVGMPLDPNVPLELNLEGNEGNQSNLYAKLLGELQYIANATQPDIAYAVNRLASYIANPSLKHATAPKQVLHYLSGTRTYGITYHRVPEYSNLFYGFANATYANADDYKSTSGYICYGSKRPCG